MFINVVNMSKKAYDDSTKNTDQLILSDLLLSEKHALSIAYTHHVGKMKEIIFGGIYCNPLRYESEGRGLVPPLGL
jgi:hypothetical protein